MAWNLLKPRTAQIDIELTDDWRTDVDSSATAYRSGDVVTVAAWRLGAEVADAGDVLAYTFPSGFSPPPFLSTRTSDSRGAEVALSGGRVTITNPSRSVSHHSFTFVTLDPMPKGGA